MQNTTPFKLKSGEYLTAPYFPLMGQILQVLKSNAYHSLALETEIQQHFSCTGCAECCQRPWWIAISREYYEHWKPIFDNHPSGKYKDAFRIRHDPTPHHYAEILRKPGTSECLFLQDDRKCFIQANYGEEALCNTCRLFPRYETWNGVYLGHFMQNSCPETAPLYQLYPRLRYQVIGMSPEIWEQNQKFPHPLGFNGGFLWLGLLLDLVHYSHGSAFACLRVLEKTLRSLSAKPLEKLSETDLVNIYPQVRHSVQQPLPPLPPQTQQGLQWLEYFSSAFSGFHAYVKEVQSGRKRFPSLQPQEKKRLNAFLKAYLFYHFATQSYRLPDGQIFFYQSYFLLTLYPSLIQWLACYFRDRDQSELTEHHLARAANLVGYRYEHASKFVQQNQIDQLSPQASLDGMLTLLSLDLAA